ncbi:MAG: pseudouridine synthase [Ghiorsea sp.]|nr:pseudouridine synthase [Ghiorsea sp.]
MRPTHFYQPPPDNGITLLFEDEHLLVVNKPAGLLSVPGNSPEKKDCMESRLQAEFLEALTVHRLDMSTSGILLFARNKTMHSAMSKLFADRKISKTYIAVVDGLVEQDKGEINAPLMVDWSNRPKQKVDAEGKPSCTYYEVISHDTEANTSRVKLTPITGRSHQLRVHMMSLGHAILGDEFYAPDEAFAKANRLLLHAAKLRFMHPITQQSICIDCPISF